MSYRVEITAGPSPEPVTDAQLKDNFNALVDAIVKAKPAGAKGKYVKKVSLTSTMGPGLKIDVAEVEGA